MYLDSLTALIVAISTASPELDITGGYTDHDGPTSLPILDRISTTGDQTLLGSPALGVDRQIQELSIVNAAAANVTLQPKLTAGTPRAVWPQVTLAPGEALIYSERRGGWAVVDARGAPRQTMGTVIVGKDSKPMRKVGTAPEAAGQYYCFAKDTGSEPAWSPGTPGLSGRTCVGTNLADAGCIPIPNVLPGRTRRLVELVASATVACTSLIYDFLVTATGLVPTTLTPQIMNTVALPARDDNGTSDGFGVYAGLLVTSATTNASAITNITMSYTDATGVSGRTATIASFPATAVVGTFVPFNLTGLGGVQSVQSVTFGTSLAGGAVALVLYRPLAMQLVPVANVGATTPARPNTVIYNGTCAHQVIIASATTANSIENHLSYEVAA
jgi:hypothetical protein